MGGNGVEVEERRHTEKGTVCVCRSDPCDAIKAGMCVCDRRLSS